MYIYIRVYKCLLISQDGFKLIRFNSWGISTFIAIYEMSVTRFINVVAIWFCVGIDSENLISLYIEDCFYIWRLLLLDDRVSNRYILVAYSIAVRAHYILLNYWSRALCRTAVLQQRVMHINELMNGIMWIIANPQYYYYTILLKSLNTETLFQNIYWIVYCSTYWLLYVEWNTIYLHVLSIFLSFSLGKTYWSCWRTCLIMPALCLF